MEPDYRRTAPGRLPERVYWFRRAFVGVCLVLILVLLVWMGALIASGTKTAAPAPKSAASQARTTSPADSLQATALPGPQTSLNSSTTSTATDQPTAAGGTMTECDPGLVTLSITGPGLLKVGASAAFTITATNVGAGACTFTFDSRFTMRIVSGSDEVWSTADCAQWGPTGSQTLASGAFATWQMTWDRHRSQASCKVVPTALKAGTYVAEAMYAGSSPANLVMLLTG